MADASPAQKPGDEPGFLRRALRSRRPGLEHCGEQAKIDIHGSLEDIFREDRQRIRFRCRLQPFLRSMGRRRRIRLLIVLDERLCLFGLIDWQAGRLAVQQVDLLARVG